MRESRVAVSGEEAIGANGRPAERFPAEAGRREEELSRQVEELSGEIAEYREIFDRVVKVAGEAANGNLEARLLHCDESEKFRTVARSVNHLLDMADAFLREAGASLEHASEGKFFRRVLLRGMRGTFREKSRLINEAMERLAGNSRSLHEVERLIDDSARIAKEAVVEAEHANQVVQKLGESSSKIDRVVKSISQVAWQTRLLAFNARIEAAHAGEAGRGFEVVAQEVKNLSQDAATSTEEIGKEIAEMREEVAQTVQALETVNKTIARMQEISQKIEQTVAEQNRRELGRSGR